MNSMGVDIMRTAIAWMRAAHDLLRAVVANESTAVIAAAHALFKC